MDACLFSLCFAQNRTHLRMYLSADLQKQYSRKGFAYLAAKRSRYCGSAEIYQEVCTDLEIIFQLSARAPHSPSAFVSHIIGSVHSPQSARNAGNRFTKNSYQPFFPRSPYLFGARDTISTNYTCCALCTFHLLASQYTAFAVCTKKQHTDAPLLW